MNVYFAERNNRRYCIQPFMIKDYADMGCKIYKQIEVEVTDIEAELENQEQTEFSGEVEGINGESN